ncbi:FecR family protein [Flavobacterium sp. JP2137]|uniref:FecR family protein n=1 Tax=Flavobacterium sp. JP2137 TaxID=3414510 RepID=UPI003D2FE2B4
MSYLSPEDKMRTRCMKYLNKELGKEDRLVFEIDLLLDEQLRNCFERVQLIWKCYPTNKNLVLKSQTTQNRVRSKVKANLRNFLGIACSLLIALMFFFYTGSEAPFFQQSKQLGKMHTYTTAFGERKKIQLEDGSTVTLNGNSKVDFQLSAYTRMVWLEGEAFFDVVKDANRKFIVKHDELQVEVLGTRFAVHSSRETKQVSLLSGQVLAKLGNGEQLYLKPNEKLLWNSRSGDVQRVTADVDQELAWRNNALIFKDEKLAVAVKRMEDFYGYSFLLQNDSLGEVRLTGVFENQSVAQFVEVLSFVSNCNISLHNKTYLIDLHETTSSKRR